MNERRFCEYLERYGAALSRWPWLVRGAARRQRRKSTDAHRAWRAAQSLERGLDAWALEPQDVRSLTARIAVRVRREPQRPAPGADDTLRWPAALWRAGLVVAGALLLGIAIGVTHLIPDGAAPVPTQALTLAYGGLPEGWLAP